MKLRLLAASIAGLAFQGLLLFRFGLGYLGPMAVQGVTVNGAAMALGGVSLITPRAASASTTLREKDAAEAQHSDESEPSEAAPSADEPQAPPTSEGAASEQGGADEGPTACPAGMLLVEGEYCPDVRHECKRWLEDTGRYAYFRCEEYSGAKCLSKERVHKRFCMDRDEWVPPGESLPASHKSWTDATKTCGKMGKRVCLESEWNFACEGEEMRPYPYGWKRDPDACNADRVDIYRPDGQLRDLRVGADDNPRCVSPFGVHNLSGNLEEWTTIDASAKSYPPRPAMKGAYWQPSRNHCRAAQTAHDRFYNGTETGFRCCADPAD